MQDQRRSFLKHGTAAIGSLTVGLSTQASTHHGTRVDRRPIGLQIYTLGSAVEKNPEASFSAIAKMGYGEIQALTYAHLAPADLRRAAVNAGLLLRTTHLDFSSNADPSALLEIAHQLGVVQVASSVLAPIPQASSAYLQTTGSMTVSDFQRVAERANRIAELTLRAGFSYAYHNHNFEFLDLGNGVCGYDVLLRETDPRYVKFELDCGWMSFAGGNVCSYLQRHAGRFSSLHIKNFDRIGHSSTLDKTASSHLTELGTGVIDYRPILDLALAQGLSYLIVEHDPRNGVPISMDMVQREFDFLNGLLATTPPDTTHLA
ncbi:sugar phosphate isomerase/epimerase family protein [Comamonas composti]|uniref:sugar phosphate isomerase/epimerase family protein n=1 Tax=Comamonas composti TaxID=408558 RepID=UPI0004024039|nr:sugar phosphate isomerase/epimerase [Comamonas composti]